MITKVEDSYIFIGLDQIIAGVSCLYCFVYLKKV